MSSVKCEARDTRDDDVIGAEDRFLSVGRVIVPRREIRQHGVPLTMM